ncbi:MAG: hypothetical protein NC084_07265 [Bacteroides sp.]|nr:hypothetical protein [Eubacterium sp.]MCM1418479.1 hypothetical protein [Roseburia sp.]MCM1462498.1 hypothetical protein [Bacteroides sp.]
MEIIGFEKDEKVLAKAEKSGGRVIMTIVNEIITVILFMVISPFVLQIAVQDAVFQYSVESWRDWIAIAMTAKAADHLVGVALIIMNGIMILQAAINIIFALVRHSRRELYLTDRRIFGHTGNLLIGKKDFNIPLSQVTRIGVQENGFTRLYRYGVVEIDSPLGKILVDGIGNPYDFTAVYQKLKPSHSLYGLSSAYSFRNQKNTYKTTWQCSCGKHNPIETEICSECGKTVFQSREENQRALAEEYRSIAAESGSFYRSVTGAPVLEKRELYSILAAAILFMLSGLSSVFSVNAAFEAQGIAPWSWLLSPIGVGVLLGAAVIVFIGIMVILKRQWAFRVLQVLMILGFVVNGLAFIGALPGLSALTYLGMVAYDVITFLLINEGSSAMSEMVQSSRRR